MNDTEICWLKSYTGKFGLFPLLQLQFAPVQTLIEVLKSRPPMDVLYALTELFQHGQYTRLREVGADEDVRKKWHEVEFSEFSPAVGYKFELEVFFEEVSPEPFG